MRVCTDCKNKHKIGSGFAFGNEGKSWCTICGEHKSCSDVEPDLDNPIERRSFGDDMDGIWAVCPYCGSNEQDYECDIYEGGGDMNCLNCEKDFHYYLKVDVMCVTEGAE